MLDNMICSCIFYGKLGCFAYLLTSASECSWEEMANGGGTGAQGGNSRSSASNSSRRGSRGRSNRGRGRPNTADFVAASTFVSATGEPVANRCFLCGDPSHFANVCPTRGSR